MRATLSKICALKMPVVWMLCVSVSLLTGACGFLDDDLAMSDEEFEASLAGGTQGTGGISISGRSHGSGCGIGGGYATHSHGGAHRLGAPRIGHRTPGTTVIDMEASHISARRAQDPTIVWHEPREDDEGDEEASDSPIYAAGELETWGDYLEAELERAQLGQ